MVATRHLLEIRMQFNNLIEHFIFRYRSKYWGCDKRCNMSTSKRLRSICKEQSSNEPWSMVRTMQIRLRSDLRSCLSYFKFSEKQDDIKKIHNYFNSRCPLLYPLNITTKKLNIHVGGFVKVGQHYISKLGMDPFQIPRSQGGHVLTWPWCGFAAGDKHPFWDSNWPSGSTYKHKHKVVLVHFSN